MKQGKLIVFSAPSGSGKTTIVKYLLEQEELHLGFSISATSRNKRNEEIDGKDYYFMTIETFRENIDQNEFIEYEEVYKGNFYGTLKSELDRIWKQDKHIIFDIDVIGGLNIKSQYPEQTMTVFVKPPSIDELEKRLRFRNTESEEKIRMRIQKAKRELSEINRFDYVLENSDLDIAKKESYLLVSNFLNNRSISKK